MSGKKVPAEFWRIFAIYIKKICNAIVAASSSSRCSSSVELLEGRVLPLLDRLDFLSECRDLQCLDSILSSLQSAGYQLPLETLKALSGDLFHKFFIKKPQQCTMSFASDLQSSRLLFDFCKRTLHNNFHNLREAINSAQSKLKASHKGADEFLQARLCLLEEEICWSICDESHLLQYVLESGQHTGADVNGTSDTERSTTDGEGSRLAGFIRCGLQSQEIDVRLQTLRLAVACSFHSHFAFTKFFPLFQTALYLEDFSFRQYVLAAFMDLIYMHHTKLTLSAVAHLIVPFLYAPTAGLQIIAVVGCGRLLLLDCFPEETESLLSSMFERYVYDPHSDAPGHASGTGDVKLEDVMKAMHCFFREYSGGKAQHQDEIANSLVYMCLEKMEEGVILLVNGSNQLGAYMKDNPERVEEARRLHLALHFGLSICDSSLDALLDSLVLNINEQRSGALTSQDHHGTHLLTKVACQNWLLQCSP